MKSLILLIFSSWCVPCPESRQTLFDDEYESEERISHHRDKRFLWITQEKRLILPPGTQMVFTPTIAMPLLRHPPEGVTSNLTISTPFTIKFDNLGLTNNFHPFGLFPFLNIGGIFGKRKKRNTPEPEIEPHEIHGGERVVLYQVVEEMFVKFGLRGSECLLRAICEMHESPLLGYGLFGEILELFLTASKSPYNKRLDKYVDAEISGKIDGDCSEYWKNCPMSIFTIQELSRVIEKDDESNVNEVANEENSARSKNSFM